MIVFSGLAGGSSQRLLAATSLLLIAQMVLLPGFLLLFMGADLADVVEVGPFVEAFVVLIVIPLTLAWLTQAWAARRPAGRKVADAMGTTMVPLMAATLVTVVALGEELAVVASQSAVVRQAPRGPGIKRPDSVPVHHSRARRKPHCPFGGGWRLDHPVHGAGHPGTGGRIASQGAVSLSR